MEDNAPNKESLNEAMESDGIFTDKSEQIDALRRSAEALGINPDLVAPKDDGPQLRYFAHKGCGHCFGRGVINVVMSPSKKKVYWKNERKPKKVSFRQSKADRSRRIGKTTPELKKITGLAPGNDIEWDTRRPEPAGYKSENMAQSFCRCIRAVEV